MPSRPRVVIPNRLTQRITDALGVLAMSTDQHYTLNDQANAVVQAIKDAPPSVLLELPAVAQLVLAIHKDVEPNVARSLTKMFEPGYMESSDL